MQMSTVNDNTAFGYGALSSNTTGSENTAGGSGEWIRTQLELIMLHWLERLYTNNGNYNNVVVGNECFRRKHNWNSK